MCRPLPVGAACISADGWQCPESPPPPPPPPPQEPELSAEAWLAISGLGGGGAHGGATAGVETGSSAGAATRDGNDGTADGAHHMGGSGSSIQSSTNSASSEHPVSPAMVATAILLAASVTAAMVVSFLLARRHRACPLVRTTSRALAPSSSKCDGMRMPASSWSLAHGGHTRGKALRHTRLSSELPEAEQDESWSEATPSQASGGESVIPASHTTATTTASHGVQETAAITEGDEPLAEASMGSMGRGQAAIELCCAVAGTAGDDGVTVAPVADVEHAHSDPDRWHALVDAEPASKKTRAAARKPKKASAKARAPLRAAGKTERADSEEVAGLVSSAAVQVENDTAAGIFSYESEAEADVSATGSTSIRRARAVPSLDFGSTLD